MFYSGDEICSDGQENTNPHHSDHQPDPARDDLLDSECPDCGAEPGQPCSYDCSSNWN